VSKFISTGRTLKRVGVTAKFIFLRGEYTVSKFTLAERELVKSKVARLTIKRIPDPEIIKEVYLQTNKTLSGSGLYNVRQSIKKDSFQLYKTMREGEYEFIYELYQYILAPIT
jgi:hypothetical protein